MFRLLIFVGIFLPIIACGETPYNTNHTRPLTGTLKILAYSKNVKLSSHDWQAYYNNQSLTEPQFLEICGQFNLAKRSQDHRSSLALMDGIGTVLLIAGCASTVYGLMIYEKEKEVARVGNLSITEKQKDPQNGFTYGGIVGGVCALGLTLSTSFSSENIIDIRTARSFAEKYNSDTNNSGVDQK